MTKLEDRIREIVKRRTPRGWAVDESEHPDRIREGLAAQACKGDKTIQVPALRSKWALYCFLHEIGHIECGHFEDNLPRWREEYEAEQFAILAMRQEGFSVSRDFLTLARESVRGCVISAQNLNAKEEVDEEVLRWAFGKKWRDWL